MFLLSLICFTNKLKNIFGDLLGGQGDYLYFCTAKVKMNAPVVQWIEYRIPGPTI